MEPLRIFFKKKIWGDELDIIVGNIQSKRNAIHAFKDKDIGTYNDLYLAVKDYLLVLRHIHFRLPYPEDYYMPLES